MDERGFSEVEFEGFLALLATMRQVKRPVASAPTHVPKNFLEMFEFYESGGTRRLYVYVGSSWRYATLT